jgi:hypothetical protein
MSMRRCWTTRPRCSRRNEAALRHHSELRSEKGVEIGRVGAEHVSVADEALCSALGPGYFRR